jgi:hypothetical protein
MSTITSLAIHSSFTGAFHATSLKSRSAIEPSFGAQGSIPESWHPALL